MVGLVDLEHGCLLLLLICCRLIGLVVGYLSLVACYVACDNLVLLRICLFTCVYLLFAGLTLTVYCCFLIVVDCDLC